MICECLQNYLSFHDVVVKCTNQYNHQTKNVTALICWFNHEKSDDAWTLFHYLQQNQVLLQVTVSWSNIIKPHKKHFKNHSEDNAVKSKIHHTTSISTSQSHEPSFCNIHEPFTVGMKANLVGSMWLSLYIWILDRWSDIIKCWKTDFITKRFCV